MLPWRKCLRELLCNLIYSHFLKQIGGKDEGRKEKNLGWSLAVWGSTYFSSYNDVTNPTREMGASQDGSVKKNPPANAGDVGSISWWGRSSGVGKGNPL